MKQIQGRLYSQVDGPSIFGGYCPNCDEFFKIAIHESDIRNAPILGVALLEKDYNIEYRVTCANCNKRLVLYASLSFKIMAEE